jgi:hypothetical protein
LIEYKKYGLLARNLILPNYHTFPQYQPRPGGRTPPSPPRGSKSAKTRRRTHREWHLAFILCLHNLLKILALQVIDVILSHHMYLLFDGPPNPKKRNPTPKGQSAQKPSPCIAPPEGKTLTINIINADKQIDSYAASATA